MLGAPDCALDEEMVTMRPQPAAIMSGTASCMQVKVPVRFTARMRSHFSGVMSSDRVEGLDAGAGDDDGDRAELVAHRARHPLERAAVGHVDLVGRDACDPRAGSSAAAASQRRRRRGRAGPPRGRRPPAGGRRRGRCPRRHRSRRPPGRSRRHLGRGELDVQLVQAAEDPGRLVARSGEPPAARGAPRRAGCRASGRGCARC